NCGGKYPLPSNLLGFHIFNHLILSTILYDKTKPQETGVITTIENRLTLVLKFIWIETSVSKRKC
ncbi:hypothetical protein ACJX0J_014216, partial [Zea mays]